jgi:hypothetical protein
VAKTDQKHEDCKLSLKEKDKQQKDKILKEKEQEVIEQNFKT